MKECGHTTVVPRLWQQSRRLGTDGGMQSSIQYCMHFGLACSHMAGLITAALGEKVGVAYNQACMSCMPACVLDVCLYMWTNTSTVPGLSWMMDPLCC